MLNSPKNRSAGASDGVGTNHIEFLFQRRHCTEYVLLLEEKNQ